MLERVINIIFKFVANFTALIFVTPREFSAKSGRYVDVKWMRTLGLTSSANNQDDYYYSNDTDTDTDGHGYSNHVFLG